MHQPDRMLRLTVLLVSSLTIMSMITISASLPQMANHFNHVENAGFLVKLILTLPGLFIALFAPLTGKLIDQYGRLKFLNVALVLYALAGAMPYFLDNIFLILVCRAFLGIAVGISMTVVNTLVADYFDGNARQKFVGIQVAFMSLGGILFIGLGGVLADFSWRLPFLIYLFSLVVLPFSLKYLYEPVLIRNQANLNIPKEKSPSIIWLLFINVMAMWLLFFIIPVQVPFKFNEIGIEKNALIGLAIALSTLFSAISSFSYAKLRSRFNFYSIFALGYTCMAIAYLFVAFSSNYITMMLAMMLAGLGIGMMIPNTNIWIMRIAPVEIRGREIGRLTTFWFLGQFLSPVLLLLFAQGITISNTFLMASGILLSLSFLFLMLKIMRPKHQPSTI